MSVAEHCTIDCGGNNPATIAFPGVNDFDIQFVYPANGGGYQGELFVNRGSEVPVPSAIFMLGSGLLGLFGFRKFQSS